MNIGYLQKVIIRIYIIHKTKLWAPDLPQSIHKIRSNTIKSENQSITQISINLRIITFWKLKWRQSLSG